MRLQGLAAPACPGADTRVPPVAPVGAPGSPCLDIEGGVDAVVDPANGALLGWGY